MARVRVQLAASITTGWIFAGISTGLNMVAALQLTAALGLGQTVTTT